MFPKTRVAALATVAMALVASPAGAHHIPGASYTGTFSAGGTVGTVKFQVSGDGESVTGYSAEAPTEFPGRSSGPYACSLKGESVLVPEPIIDHEVDFRQSDGSFFKGKFSGRQTASGTLQIAVGGGTCKSDVLTWTASTTASPAGSEECKAAKGQVRKAEKALKGARTGRARKKARSRLGKAKKKRKDACGASSPTGSAAAAPQNGVFKGRTAQGKSFSLTVKGGVVRKLKYAFKIGGCGVETTTTGKIRVSGGKFRHSSSQFDPNALRSLTTVIEGRFTTPTSVKGAIKAETACGSKKIGFSARRA